MSWGGKRPGAGRKPNAEIRAIRTVLAETIPEQEWIAIIDRLVVLAIGGNFSAAKLLVDMYLSERVTTRRRPRRPSAYHQRAAAQRVNQQVQVDNPKP